MNDQKIPQLLAAKCVRNMEQIRKEHYRNIGVSWNRHGVLLEGRRSCVDDFPGFYYVYYLSKASSSSWVSSERGPLQRRSNMRCSKPLRRSTPRRPWVIERIQAKSERLLAGPLRRSCRRSGEFLLSGLRRLQLLGDLRSTPSQGNVLIRAFMAKQFG